MPPLGVGTRIRDERERLKLSQEQLAEKTGWSAATISRHETGVIEPSISDLKKYAEALGVKLKRLLSAELAA